MKGLIGAGLVRRMLAGLMAAGLVVLAPVALADNAEQGQMVAAVTAEVVNVNTASAEELARVLVGVGLSRAAAIVAYRETHGAFTDLGDLVLVRGIGQATLARNQARLRLAD